MKTIHPSSNLIPAIIFLLIILGLLATKWVLGQTPALDPHAGHHPPPSAATTPAPNVATPAPAPDAAAEKGMGMMGMMGMKKQMMKGAQTPAMGGGMAKPEGCQCEMMGGKKDDPPAAAEADAAGLMRPGMATERAAAATPGVAGTSHLFPIGARGFFLNHSNLIALLPAQARALRQLREKTALEQAEFGRKLASSEQAWWVLAAADSPDAAKMSIQLAASESIRTARRGAYVKAVIEAIGLLTEEQRQILLGTRQPSAGGRDAGGH